MNDTPRTSKAAGTPTKKFELVAESLFGCSQALELENNALRARVESASAIITELLARTAKTESPECDEAVAAAMAWLHDKK